MAQRNEDFSNKIPSTDNSDSEDNALPNGSHAVKPDLGFENVSYANNPPNGAASTSEQTAVPKSSTQTPRKEESPFSFKHFLKGDTVPSSSASYESTGAKPKVYTTAPHCSGQSKANILQQEARKETKSTSKDIRTNGSSDAPIRLNHKENETVYQRLSGNIDSGLPSLPDFVQDHLLVEQAYGVSRVPLSLHLENLPDFTLNASLPEELYQGEEAAGQECRPSPLDLPSHLALDLTDSLSPSHRCHRSFPLDLPANPTSQGSEPLRLPDFLPAQANGGAGGAGAAGTGGPSQHDTDTASLERDSHNVTKRQLTTALQNASWLRHEVSEVRASAQQAQREATEARSAEQQARREAAEARLAEQQARREATEARSGEQQARREAAEARATAAQLARDLRGSGRIAASSGAGEHEEHSTAKRGSNDETNPAKLKSQISQLKEELAMVSRELEEMRSSRRTTAQSLTQTANATEATLRDVMLSLQQLRGLASSLDPP